jgi:hypothetical protein
MEPGEFAAKSEYAAQPGPETRANDNQGSDSEKRRIPSKYPIGMALIELPFLAVGDAIRRAVEAVGVDVAGADGYSAIELWSVAIGQQLLSVIGLTTLHRLLADEYW